ncbi:MAG: glycosyltransferase family 1 protein, partial [Deltaproteobacteria bacterium]
GEFIFFRGPLYGTEKVRELVSSDIFVFPTHPPEAFPLVILEAMAVGLPIVSTEVGSIPEIVADGVNGFVVPPRNPQALASAVVHLIKDEIMRQNFGRASRRLFEERYTFESYRKNLYKIFKLIDATGGMT